MKYFYARVSSKEQNLDRQLTDADGMVFCDKQSGKDMDRPEYQRMKSMLCKGDEVIIHELDRLGRDKALVKEEIAWYKDMGITLRIKNIPTTMIDFGDADWIQDMVTNIIIEVMSSLAEEERHKIHSRQRQGIDAMEIREGRHYSRKRGNYYGRPRSEIDWDLVEGMTVEEACEMLGISRSTYYKRRKEVG